jgi:hypothetical protein
MFIPACHLMIRRPDPSAPHREATRANSATITQWLETYNELTHSADVDAVDETSRLINHTELEAR